MKTNSRKKGKKHSVEGKGLSYYMALQYPSTVEEYEEEGGKYFSLSIPDLPGCGAVGETIEQALVNLAKAKEAWFEVCLEEGLSIPEPVLEDEFSGKFLLRIPPHLHMRLSKRAEREGKSLNQYIRSILDAKVNQDNDQWLYDILPVLRALIQEEIIPLSQRINSLEESFNNISDSILSSSQRPFVYSMATFQRTDAMQIHGRTLQSAQSGQLTHTALSGQATKPTHFSPQQEPII